jgi:hypothetical protein
MDLHIEKKMLEHKAEQIIKKINQCLEKNKLKIKNKELISIEDRKEILEFRKKLTKYNREYYLLQQIA